MIPSDLDFWQKNLIFVHTKIRNHERTDARHRVRTIPAGTF